MKTSDPAPPSDGLADWIQTRLFDAVHGGLFLATGKADHEGHYEDGVWRNWTDSYQERPRHFRRPSGEAELVAAVAGAERLRVVGGGHTFNDSPLCADTMISLDDHAGVLHIDPAARTATVGAGIRLRDLNQILWQNGLALPVLGSTDAQSIAGLIATDLHGTGRDHGFLSESVRGLRLIAADGSAATVRPGDERFHAAIGALGTVGVVSEVELALVPAFHLEKTTTMVDRAETEASIEALLAQNQHLSLYYVGGGEVSETVRLHRWNHTTAPLTEDWQRHKRRAELSDFAISAFLPGAAELLVRLDEDAALSNALAPDHALVMPSSEGFGRKLFYRHDEIEYGVPFARWLDALGEVMDLLRARDFFSIVEIRFTPDQSVALLGPGVGRRTAYIELATPLSQDTGPIYAEVEAIFDRYGGQPHLGKKTSFTAEKMAATYGERFARHQAVRRAQDPRGKFLNDMTRRIFGAP